MAGEGRSEKSRARSWEEDLRELSENTKRQADEHRRLCAEREDILRAYREVLAQLEQARVVSAYEAGRQHGLEAYRDAFIRYYPDQQPQTLDRHFPDAFPYAQTDAPLSPLPPRQRTWSLLM